MKLTVLVDNNTAIGHYFSGEPALSFLIETEGKKILLDAGYSDLFIQNAEKMGLDLRTLDYITVSHGHFDHTWGLAALIKFHTEARMQKLPYNRPVLVAHPLAFKSKTVDGSHEIGSLIDEEQLTKHFNLQYSKEPLWLTERLVFLGEIARKTSFEAKRPLGKVGQEDDYLYDDTALAYKTADGLVVIAGCSHSGICNIIEQAKRVCQDDRIIDIVGGFHLLKTPEEQMQGTLDYFSNLKNTIVHACHCTDLQAKIALSSVVKLKEVGVGLKLKYQ